jgi:hypothetical protein
VASFCNNRSLADKCPYEKAILNTLQVYGLVLLDGTIPGDNWDSDLVSDEFFPNQLVDAIDDLNHSAALGYNQGWPNGGGFEQYLEIVDESRLQVSTDPRSLGLTNNGRVTVSLTTSHHGSSRVDVNLVGTTVGVDRGRVTIAAQAGNSYQIHAWVNGNTNTNLTYTMSPPVYGASVSGSGLVSVSDSTRQVTKTTVSVCSAAEGATAQCAYVDIFFIPLSPDGSLRLWFGGKMPSYKDGSGNVWWGQISPRAFNSNYEIADGISFASLNGTWKPGSAWAAFSDAQLHAESDLSP